MQHYISFLNHLIDSSNYWKYYFLNPFPLTDDVCFDNNFKLSCGVTRGALVDDNYPIIVKFNLVTDDDDCCDKEQYYYKCAEEYEISQCFAACKFCGYFEKKIMFADLDIGDVDEYDFNNIVKMEDYDLEEMEIVLPLYQYERAILNWKAEKATKQETEIVYSVNSPLTERNVNIAARFLRDWGSEIYEKLSLFLEAHEINDIHNGNVGVINGKIVLIDYAGYV